MFHRERRRSADGKWNPVLVVLSALEYPTPSSLGRLDHEYGLKDELDSAWAVRPLELVREGGRTMLVLEDPGSEPLAGRLGAAMETELFLRIGIGIAAALGGAHQRGLVHKDIKPANILVTGTGAEVRLTGFGIASRLSRERQTHEPPEVVAGTLAYMAPEQTGRMNRSVDSRSDLYALGVTLYEMLTGSLPFSASEPMEWVHCHIARRPTPPDERVADVSPAVSAIVMKLLSKTAEERYQTAGGVEHDLGRCLSQWERQCRIDAFPLGERDIPDRLLIPEKLYGREHEVETLLTAFDRVVSSGAPELVLVSGYSGIGKSTVVNELHKALVPPRGLFASGKFDQYKRDIPYATLAQAFQSLVRELLAKSDADLALWRETLIEALGPNGRLMVDLVPELKLIIGDQPPVAELPPQDAERRFELVFRRFIGVFAQPGHPLALFLDDLQWLDASRAIEELIDLPLMSDPASSSTLDILTRLVGAVWHTDANLACMAICLAVNLSLERGNSDGSCYHYVSLGYIAGPRFGDYEAGLRFGQLGCHLVEKYDLKRFQARTYKDFGAHIMPWTRHVRTGRDILRRALDIANQSGDLTFAGYSYVSLNSNLLAAGDPLMEVQRQAEIGLTFAQAVRFQFVIDLASAQLGLVRTLRGLTRRFGSFDDEGFDELEIERRFSENPNLAETCYFVRKLQARFFAGDYEAAVDASLRAQRLPWTSVSHFEETPEHHFYGALARAACCDHAVAEQRAWHTEALVAHHRQLQIYAKNCPENFENRAALVGAEIARLEAREIDAVRLYEQAIRSARANGFVHHEALAYELAARFYAQGGFEDFTRLYLRNARGCYLRWGADGKVRQLDQLYPDLRGEERASSPTSTIGAPVEQLDLATVIKISQAVSGEIVLQKLIDTVLRTAVEQAGAERGLLILPRDGESRITAEATTGGETVVVQMLDEIVTGDTLPQSLLHYVLRTSESVVLDDAMAQNPFSADPYICQHGARSVLCVPLLNQGQLAGVLYLENNLAPRVFAPARIAVLKLLASQAAISLENTRLYRDLAEREAKIRRLVKANIIGIVIWNIEGRVLEANDAFLHMVGYDRDDLASGRLCWTELTPAEWRDRDARTIAELKKIGSVQPFEKEYVRKDGSRLPVLIGGALLEESGDEGVSFVLDLAERRQAEEALRESEEALRVAQGQLAHANRVATMGQLTASIAHEVNQPLAASLTNAQAALRWLGTHPPNLEEVAQALGRIAENANRAGDVIGRIRALVKKEPPRNGQFDLNEAIRHVIALTSSEVHRQGVMLRTEFATSLPSVKGDRIQVQQVVLNLIMNAIEAMSGIDAEERELLISTESESSGGVVVGVRDSGPGLDPQTMDHLFEAFYTTKSSGMGMGLAICRSIIEAHGGRMWATANRTGGAVFLFTLPLERDETIGAKPADQMAAWETA